MNSLRDPSRYREEAAHFREVAAGTTDRRLRDSFLGLALQYERLAQILEKSTARQNLTVAAEAFAEEPGPTG